MLRLAVLPPVSMNIPAMATNPASQSASTAFTCGPDVEKPSPIETRGGFHGNATALTASTAATEFRDAVPLTAEKLPPMNTRPDDTCRASRNPLTLGSQLVALPDVWSSWAAAFRVV